MTESTSLPQFLFWIGQRPLTPLDRSLSIVPTGKPMSFLLPPKLSWNCSAMAGIQSYLQGHGCILLANIVVVLVSIKHDDSIGQGKAGIAIGKWGAITILKNQRPHLCQCPSLANQTLTTNPLVNDDKEEGTSQKEAHLLPTP